jgi:membrane protease YdiL (CAAX protease family)
MSNRTEQGAGRADAKPLVAFFLIACIPPWIGWSLLTFGVVDQHAPFAPLLYFTGWGASVGGLVATGMSEGFGGVRRLLGQAVRVIAPVRWWLYVLLVPPALQSCSALASFAATGKPVAMEPAALLSLATPAVLLPFFFGPFGEEFGWRGFLLPDLVRRVSALPACLIVGVIWALWHWPLEYQAIVQVPGLVWFATCMSVMIAAVYLRTQSLLLAMIMHWNFDSMLQISPRLFPGAAPGMSAPLAVWGSAGAYALVAALTVPALLTAERKRPTA